MADVLAKSFPGARNVWLCKFVELVLHILDVKQHHTPHSEQFLFRNGLKAIMNSVGKKHCEVGKEHDTVVHP